MKGNFKSEYIFSLQQAYDCWKFYHVKIDECDKQIESLLTRLTKSKPSMPSLSKAKPIRHHKRNVDMLHAKLGQLLEGKDPTALPGITDYNLMQIIAEVGTNLSQWPSAKHFTSWAGLAPGQNSSGKMVKRSRKKVSTKTGQIFRKTAQSLLQSKHIALGVCSENTSQTWTHDRDQSNGKKTGCDVL